MFKVVMFVLLTNGVTVGYDDPPQHHKPTRQACEGRALMILNQLEQMLEHMPGLDIASFRYTCMGVGEVQL